MKRAAECGSEISENQISFNFEFASNREPCLKAGNEENIEYTSFNLALAKLYTIPCSKEKASFRRFYPVIGIEIFLVYLKG